MPVVISPLTVITVHLDMINIGPAIPRAVGRTQVHCGYFHPLDDNTDMMRHRLRQAGNMPRWEWYRKAMGFVRDEA